MKTLPVYAVNGWSVAKRPNTFAERWAWEASAYDAHGFRTTRVGFNTLRAARAYCEGHKAPMMRPQPPAVGTTS